MQRVNLRKNRSKIPCVSCEQIQFRVVQNFTLSSFTSLFHYISIFSSYYSTDFSIYHLSYIHIAGYTIKVRCIGYVFYIVISAKRAVCVTDTSRAHLCMILACYYFTNIIYVLLCIQNRYCDD